MRDCQIILQKITQGKKKTTKMKKFTFDYPVFNEDVSISFSPCGFYSKKKKPVCSPLIHDQALSDPARHANRPPAAQRHITQSFSHQSASPTPHHRQPRADSGTLPQSSYLSWQTGLRRMLQVSKISAAS